MKYLVTGATGMVGHRLVERLVERHGKDSVLALTSPFSTPEQDRRRGRLTELGVRQVPANLLDRAALAGLPSVDVVFHMAADLRIELHDDAPDAPIRTNDIGTANLIDALAAQLKGKLFVYASSIGVTDKIRPGPERVSEETPCSPRTLYGKTKLRGEEIVREKSRALGFRYAIFRLATVYGPRGRENHVVDHFTRWVKSGAWRARIHWPGKISLVYIDDVVDVLMAAADRKELQGSVFYVSNHEELTVGQMIEVMAAQAGKSTALIRLPAWLVQVLTWSLFQNWLVRRLPGALYADAWRLSLLISNVFYCDSSKLNRIYPKVYIGVREGIRMMHEDLLSSRREVEYANRAH